MGGVELMKQLLQSLKNGEMEIAEVPFPRLHPKGVLVRNYYSVISAGTEKSKVEVARKTYIGKAIMKPDQVKMVLNNVKKEGFKSTYQKVLGKIGAPAPLGYSSAGIVIDVGSDVTEFRVGDRVACAGAGYANHAEVVYVPQNLCAAIPDEVSMEEAAFTTVACIAMHGIRQAGVRLGENVAVIGLGLIGQLTVEMLKAAGCSVVACDLKNYNVDMALENGADFATINSSDFEKRCCSISNGYGVDACIITAGTADNGPIEIAGRVTRKKGRVVVVGAVKMDIPRSHYYEKEIEIGISCSYGPGRYDGCYEEFGIDYPYAYARWTENRNMQAFLRLIKDKKIHVKNIATHTFPFENAVKAYDMIMDEHAEPYVGILLKYDVDSDIYNYAILRENRCWESENGKIGVSVIGGGNFSKGVLLPALKKAEGINLRGVLTATGYTAKGVGDNFGFEYYTSDEKHIMSDGNTEIVIISTRHDSHGRFVMEALKNNKSVYVEKPLAISEEELKEIVHLYNNMNSSGGVHIMVGYNRRFSPSVINIKNFYNDRRSPLFMNYRVNAGYIPENSWIQDEKQGGGRIIGEVCHFIDTMQYLTGANPVRVYADSIRLEDRTKDTKDVVNINIRFNDGSIGVINYLSNGDSSLEKERLEVFGEAKAAVMKDFKEEEYYVSGKKKIVKHAQNKGHGSEMKTFIQSLQNNETLPISFESLIYTSLTTFKILDSIKSGKTEVVDIEELFKTGE